MKLKCSIEATKSPVCRLMSRGVHSSPAMYRLYPRVKCRWLPGFVLPVSSSHYTYSIIHWNIKFNLIIPDHRYLTVIWFVLYSSTIEKKSNKRYATMHANVAKWMILSLKTHINLCILFYSRQRLKRQISRIFSISTSDDLGPQMSPAAYRSPYGVYLYSVIHCACSSFSRLCSLSGDCCLRTHCQDSRMWSL